MKRTILFTLLLLGPGHAFAQDKPKAADTPIAKADAAKAALPEKIVLTDETDKVRMVQLRLTAIANEAQILRDRVDKLNAQLQKEQEELNAVIIRSITKHGLKADDLQKYEFRNAAPLDTGPIQLVKKPEPKEQPPEAAKPKE